MDGVSQHHRNIDELLGKSLDNLLINHVSLPIKNRLSTTSTLSQIAQVITNLEHFEVACVELEKSLTSLRFVPFSCGLFIFHSALLIHGFERSSHPYTYLLPSFLPSLLPHFPQIRSTRRRSPTNRQRLLRFNHHIRHNPYLHHHRLQTERFLRISRLRLDTTNERRWT